MKRTRSLTTASWAACLFLGPWSCRDWRFRRLLKDSIRAETERPLLSSCWRQRHGRDDVGISLQAQELSFWRDCHETSGEVCCGTGSDGQRCGLDLRQGPAGEHAWPAPPVDSPAPRSKPITSPLKVLKSNPNYFTNDTGKAIYLTGSHSWNTFRIGGRRARSSPWTSRRS